WSVVSCGVGAERARAAADQLVAHGASRLLVWGTAGALHADVQPGAVILAERVLDGHSVCYPATAHWHAHLLAALSDAVDVNVGPLVSVNRFVSDYAAKAELAQKTAAIAVDMEAAAVARVAAENAMPFAALRVIV